jgi:hypothetical protein
MTTRKPRRRPVQAKDLADLQTLLDAAARRDTADTNTTPTNKEK